MVTFICSYLVIDGPSFYDVMSPYIITTDEADVREIVGHTQRKHKKTLSLSAKDIALSLNSSSNITKVNHKSGITNILLNAKKCIF